MDPNKLKNGDFLTWNFDGSSCIAIGRIISFERYKFDTKHKLNGKVCAAQMLIFPHWNEGSEPGYDQFARVSGYYLERAEYSSEAEVTAWLKCAMEYEDELRKGANAVSKCLLRPIDKRKVVLMDNLSEYDTERLPPTHYFNWLWSCLQRFKLYNHKKGTVLLWGTKLWKPRPKTKLPI